MEDDLPLEYDVIVIGTGMTESITAAALSRIGKKVLHLDSDQYYGGIWASFNFKDLSKTLDGFTATEKKSKIGVTNISSNWHIKKKDIPIDIPVNVEEKVDENIDGDKEQIEEGVEVQTDAPSESQSDAADTVKVNTESETEWTQESIEKEYRRFNIDLTPKLLFARGELVELLISSNISRYTEFRCVNRVLTWLDNKLEPVPCSRSDVFSTKHVTVVEKRMLMKLLTFLTHYNPNSADDLHEIENKTFLDFLKSKKLTKNLIHYVLYAIAGGTDQTTCHDGIIKCKKFLNCLGRFGNTPFLWSMYGCGELPQSFCRLCAVFGGIYYLNRPIDKIEIEEKTSDESKSLIKVYTNTKELKCEHIVMSVDKAPEEFLPNIEFTKGISRAVFIINKSIHEMDKESLTLLQFPPLEGKKNPVTIIELGPSTYACPKNLYVLHMTSIQTTNAKEDLQEYAEKLLCFDDNIVINSTESTSDEKPKVLWSLYFNMTDTSNEDLNIPSKPNVHVCRGPDIELDFDRSVNEARQIFTKICGDSEFLPRAPDCNEIFYEDNAEPEPIFESDIIKEQESQAENEVTSVDTSTCDIENNVEDNPNIDSTLGNEDKSKND